MILDPGFGPIAERISSLLFHVVETDEWGENDTKVFKFEVEQLLEVAAGSGFDKEQVFQEMEEMEGPLQLSPTPSSVARNFFEVRLTLTREPF